MSSYTPFDWLASSLMSGLLLSVVATGDVSSVAVASTTAIAPERQGIGVSIDGRSVTPFPTLASVGQPLINLQDRLNALQTTEYAGLDVGIAMVDMQTGNYLSINGDQVFPTASIIKVPILIALFQDVDAGKARLTETLTMTRDVIAGGSGDLQYRRPDSQLSLLETATKMITISDNTATNMIIKRLGGISTLNQRFRQWGLQKTQIHNVLPDRFGTNVTTATELVQLLARLDQQQLLSAQSRAQVLQIMSQVRDRRLLAAGLGPGAAIAHKTGDIGFLQGDTGIIRTPSGKRYLVAILVKTENPASSAQAFIQAASRLVYRYFNQPSTTARTE